MSAVEKQLEIKLESPSFVQFLIRYGFRLCLARMVNDQYDVTWHALEKISSFNIINWVLDYGVFKLQAFKTGDIVKEPSTTRAVVPGQQVELLVDGSFGEPTKQPNAPHSIIVDNQFGPTHLGLTMPNYAQNLPTFVQRQQAGLGPIVLSPEEKIAVWLQQDILTGTAVDAPPSSAIEVDMAGVTAKAIRNINGAWSQDN